MHTATTARYVTHMQQEGDRLVREQQHVLDWRLSEEYLKTQTGSASIIGLSGG